VVADDIRVQNHQMCVRARIEKQNVKDKFLREFNFELIILDVWMNVKFLFVLNS
jgi:hypothetical protein